MITNENGEVALRAYQVVRKYVAVNGHEYVFVPQHNISLAWIQLEDVNSVLSIKRECCGGSKNPYFRYANQHDIDIWTGAVER